MGGGTTLYIVKMAALKRWHLNGHLTNRFTSLLFFFFLVLAWCFVAKTVASRISNFLSSCAFAKFLLNILI